MRKRMLNFIIVVGKNSATILTLTSNIYITLGQEELQLRYGNSLINLGSEDPSTGLEETATAYLSRQDFKLSSG